MCKRIFFQYLFPLCFICKVGAWFLYLFGGNHISYIGIYFLRFLCSTVPLITVADQFHISLCWKRPWCWERLKAGGEGDDRGWDGWMTLPTRWTWVWASSGSWWWTGKSGMLQSMGSLGHDWAMELNWWWEQNSFLVFKSWLHFSPVPNTTLLFHLSQTLKLAHFSIVNGFKFFQIPIENIQIID